MRVQLAITVSLPISGVAWTRLLSIWGVLGGVLRSHKTYYMSLYSPIHSKMGGCPDVFSLVAMFANRKIFSKSPGVPHLMSLS